MRLLFFLLFLSSLCFAQEYELKGRVSDSLGKPLESANLIATPEVKGEGLKFATTDIQGRYRLSLKKGITYLVRVSYIGYNPENLTINLSNGSKTQDFKLSSKGIDLDEVTINYEYKPVEIKKDTTVYQVSAFSDGTERKLREILNNLPGIEVDRNGVVTFKGQRITKVLVEDKLFFGGSSKLAVENIPADALKEIEVIEDYNEVKFLKGLTDNEDLALNVKLKEDKKKFVFGDVDAGGGIDNFYKLHAGLFYYSPKTSINFIGDLNNTGTASLTFEDLSFFTGGSSFLSGRTSLGSLNTLGRSNRDILSSINQFSGFNINQEINSKFNIQGYAVYSRLRTETRNSSLIQFLSDDEATFEARENNENKTEILGLANLKLDYTPNDKTRFYYNANLELSDSDFTGSINTNVNDLATFFNTENDVENINFKQYLEWHQSFSKRFVSTFVFNHVFERSTPLNSYVTDQPFLGGLLPLIDQSEINVQQVKEVERNGFDGLLKNYWIVNSYNHLYLNLGFRSDREFYFTEDVQLLDDGTINNFESAGFGNDTDFEYLDAYIGLEYKFKIKKFTGTVSGFLHRFNVFNDQNNEQTTAINTTFFEPRFNARYEFSRSNKLGFNYRYTNSFRNGNSYADRFELNGFNRVIRGNAELGDERFHRFSLNYNKSNVYRGLYFFSVFTFNRKERNIRNQVQLNGINQFTTPILTDNPETNITFLGNLRKDLKKVSFNIGPTYTQSTYIQNVNGLIDQNRRSNLNLSFSANTKPIKNLPSIRLNYQKGFSRLTGTNNITSDFQTDTFNADFGIRFFKNWFFKTNLEYFVNNNDINRETFTIGNASLRYNKEDSAWTFVASVNNYLNNGTKNRTNFTDFTIVENTTFVLPRIFLFTISYKL